MLRLIFALVLSLLTLVGYSQTVTWVIEPEYDDVQPYNNHLYKVSKNSKMGLADKTGKLVLEIAYDSITSYHEHVALALLLDDVGFQLKKLIYESNNLVLSVDGSYYIHSKYPFYSEGKLVVSNEVQKYGYLGKDGILWKDFLYEKAYPFYQGRACVHKNGKVVSYLKESGEELVTAEERAGAVMVSGSSFNEKGEAYVQYKSMGMKRCIINTRGDVIRDAKFSNQRIKNYEYRRKKVEQNPVVLRSFASSNRISPFCQKGFYGYKNGEDELVPAQFQEAFPFDESYAIAKYNGKYGVLKLLPESFTDLESTQSMDVVNGKVSQVVLRYSLPLNYSGKSLRLLVETMEGTEVCSSENVINNVISVVFTPSISGRPDNLAYQVRIESGGILLKKEVKTLAMNYITQKPLVVYPPQLGSGFKIGEDSYVRADDKNTVTIYVVVENPSSFDKQLTVDITGEDVQPLHNVRHISSHNKVVFTTCIENIKERKNIEVVVHTSDGVKKSSFFAVKPFI